MFFTDKKYEVGRVSGCPKVSQEVLLILEKERSSLYSGNPKGTAAGGRNKQPEL